VAETFDKKSINAEAARKMIEAAEAKAREIGIPMATTVVDAEGTLKAFSRMDGCALLPVQVSQDKAWTAISFGVNSNDFWGMMKDNDQLRSYLPNVTRMAAIGGGAPLRTSDGQLVGGIGVSGGMMEDDMQCMDAALAVFKG